MAMAEVSVVPLGTGTPSISQYVAQAVRVLEGEKDINYELTAMGTIMEGDLAELLALVARMHQAVFDAGALRAVTTIKIDDRRDKTSSLSGKLESLRNKLGEQVR